MQRNVQAARKASPSTPLQPAEGAGDGRCDRRDGLSTESRGHYMPAAGDSTVSSRAQAAPADRGACSSMTTLLRTVARFNKRQLRSLVQMSIVGQLPS